MVFLISLIGACTSWKSKDCFFVLNKREILNKFLIFELCAFNLENFISNFRVFWLFLVVLAAYATISIGLRSLDRYKTKNTVVSIEKDHYYWNTTLPSLTICPTVKRINTDLLDKYCVLNHIEGRDKTEFADFIESMANASYNTFHQIKDYKSIEVSIKK